MQLTAFLLPLLAALALAHDEDNTSRDDSMTRDSTDSHDMKTHMETATMTRTEEPKPTKTDDKPTKTDAKATHTGAANTINAADIGVVMAGIMGAAAFL